MSNRVTTERVSTFMAKYGEEAAKELINIINDTRIDLGYADEKESESLAAMIHQGTKEIVEQKKYEK
ncbi:hypothetical protein [Massilibacteroides sp.]|uniref:hypothetical protein n=1 Tax=Massilibacteroides sp. TaxID=2034766 RepID=UPI0026235F06|nr:hypothetical protein [Massilibacteroides sp.]MDD4515727.1 hypothetical protein [Massilibacteroides sp.]